MAVLSSRMVASSITQICVSDGEPSHRVLLSAEQRVRRRAMGALCTLIALELLGKVTHFFNVVSSVCLLLLFSKI